MGGSAGNMDLTIGKNLRAFRKERNLSQQGLAEICGVTFQQIQKYEKGINRISASTLWNISEGLSVKITDFFFTDNFEVK